MTNSVFNTGALQSRFSLKPLVDHLRHLHLKSGGPVSNELGPLLEAVDRHPEILKQFGDVPEMGDLTGLGHHLISTVMPQASRDQEATAVFMPLKPRCFYASESFSNTLLDANGKLRGEPDINSTVFAKNLLRRAYLLILQRIYGVQQKSYYIWHRTVRDPETGLNQYFRLKTNQQFVNIEIIAEPPELSDTEKQTILEHLNEPEVVQTILPLTCFRLNGFVVIQAEDVTETEIIAAIGKDLIDKDSIFSPTGFHRTETRLRMLFRRPDMIVRLAAIHGDRILQLRTEADAGHGRVEKQSTELPISRLFETGFHRIVDSDRILVVPDLLEEQHRSWVDEKRIETGIRSLLVLPLSYKGNVIGAMDLGSPRPYDIGHADAWLAEDIMPLFAVALKRGLDDLDKEVQSVIKQECTAVHPAVEWRFREVALEHLERLAQGRESKLEPVLFRDVHRLFGVSDVRGSTEVRNRAIREDLLEHIDLAQTILSLAEKHNSLALLKYQALQVEKFKTRVLRGVGTGDERSLIAFMKKELEPLFPVLGQSGEPVVSAVAAYQNSVDPSTGTVYKKRKAFEQSIERLNSRMAKYMDQEQKAQQEVFPHYFEKHQTDGLDYLIYLGPSMARHDRFSEVYVQNMRLWQIFLACGFAWHARDLHNTLKIKLDLTHLIIMSQAPLSIRFRFDEKRFDVDGAYNIAHEIVTSRIEKTMVKGGSERLTQPQRIAMIYSTKNELEEILRYVELLQNETFLTGEVEDLELEDLSDIQKLSAVRVRVNVESAALAQRVGIK